MKTSKKNTSQQTDLYTQSQTFWCFMKFYCKLQIVHIMLILLLIYIKHFQHWEIRKNKSKLNFTKNRQATWFSCRRLKISKISISLAWLGECSKIRLHHWTLYLHVNNQRISTKGSGDKLTNAQMEKQTNRKTEKCMEAIS